MPRLSILIDVKKCTGCYNCFLACRDEYYDNDYPGYSTAQPLNGQFWMQVKEIERGEYPKPRLDYVPVPCMHCQNAPCMDAAKDGAVYRREDGIVMIDPEKAKGQADIVNACPYRVIFWNADLEIPQKCTLCAHRLDEGEGMPRCVECCPTGALVFGDLDDPNSEIAKLAAENPFAAFHPEFDTQPNVLYHRVPQRFVAGEVVLADQQGECAKGVTVKLEGAGLAITTESDSYGDFEFDDLPKNAEFKIIVAHEGYATRELTCSTKKNVNLAEIVLEPH